MSMKYIGARYMPKFMGTYDATAAYEALSVVDNGAGTSYVSNKPVPAGTPLSDSEYWTIYGASSGAILDLENRMQAAEDDITAINGDISAINGDIATINANIDRLDVFSELKNKTIAIYGASNELAINTQGENWTDLLAAYLTGYSTIVNKSVNGKKLTEAISDFNNDPDRTDYDIVIFCCTKNQFIAQTASDIGVLTFLGNPSIENAFSALSTHLTAGQTIYFASCTPYRDNFKTYPMCLYDGVVKRLAAKYGHRTLDMHSWLGCSDYDSYNYTYDSLHFKAEVAPIFAKHALKALLAGGESFSNYSCKLSGTDVFSYIDRTATKPAGLTELTDGSNAVRNTIYCDVELHVNLICGFVNQTGSALASGSNLLTGMNNIMNNKYMCNKVQYAYKQYNGAFSVIREMMRPERISVEDAVENGAEFYLIFGDVDTQYAFS